MKDEDKTKEQLVRELVKLRQHVADLEKAGTRPKWTEKLMEQHAVSQGLIWDSLPNPFYVIDASDYTIKVANSAANFGHLQKDSNCYALTHKTARPCGSAEHPCPLEKIRETKRPVRVEHLHPYSLSFC